MEEFETAQLKFAKELEEVEKELAVLDERVYECEEFQALSSSLEFAENLAMGAQFNAASKELNQARQQFLTKIKWINSAITGKVRKFDLEEKKLLPAYSPEVVSVAPPEKNITLTAPSIAPPIESKQESLSAVELPVKVNSPRDKCLDLLVKISPIWQAHEHEFDNDISGRLIDANKLYERGYYEVAHTKLLAILPDLESQIKRFEQQKKLVITGSTLVLFKTPQERITETKRKTKNKENRATATVTSKLSQKSSSSSLYALYLSLSAAAAICFIFYAIYYQLSSAPEQTRSFKR